MTTRNTHTTDGDFGEILADRFIGNAQSVKFRLAARARKARLYTGLMRVRFRSFFSKILILFLAAGLNFAGLHAIGETFSVFFDTEASRENTFQAAMLDFSVTNVEHDVFLGVTLGEDYEFASVVTDHPDSLPIQYEIQVEKHSDEGALCGAIDLEAVHTTTDFDGALLSFEAGPTSELGTWAFELNRSHLSTGIAHGAVCDIDFLLYGWRDGIGKAFSGFDDEERIRVTLTSRMIVLNEFLPRPDREAYGFDFGSDSSDMPQGEWVEIYNNSDYDFDLDGWYIWDASGFDANKIYITAANTAPATTTIKAHDWLVVYMNKAVLNNTGDTVKLYDDADRLVDAHTYSGSDYCELEPTPGDGNESSSSGECTKVPPNKSYARIPDGIGAWVDPVPTPGFPNTEDEKDGVKSLNAFVENAGGDFEAPVVTVSGANPAYIPLGASYSDNGAFVTDNKDTNLGVTVVDLVHVDTDTLGTYEVLYTSQDSAGNKGEAVRTVVVYDPSEGIPNTQDDSQGEEKEVSLENKNEEGSHHAEEGVESEDLSPELSPGTGGDAEENSGGAPTGTLSPLSSSDGEEGVEEAGESEQADEGDAPESAEDDIGIASSGENDHTEATTTEHVSENIDTEGDETATSSVDAPEDDMGGLKSEEKKTGEDGTSEKDMQEGITDDSNEEAGEEEKKLEEDDIAVADGGDRGASPENEAAQSEVKDGEGGVAGEESPNPEDTGEKEPQDTDTPAEGGDGDDAEKESAEATEVGEDENASGSDNDLHENQENNPEDNDQTDDNKEDVKDGDNEEDSRGESDVENSAEDTEEENV